MSGLVSGQWPPKGFVRLDCGHVVKKSHPIIPTNHGEACSEFCAQSIAKNPPPDPLVLLEAITMNPSQGSA